jgi:hypothetical protein
MNKNFYNTIPFAIVDSILLKNNAQGYVKRMPYMEINTAPETKHHWKKIKGTSKKEFGMFDPDEVCVRGNIEKMAVISKGFGKDSENRAIKTMSDEEWLYNFLIKDNKENNSIFKLGVSYDTEHTFPFDSNIFKAIMLWKLIEGATVITNQSVKITEKELAIVNLNTSLKDAGRILIEYFGNRIVRITLDQDTLNVHITRPTYSFNGGSGSYKFDLSGPNQVKVIDAIIEYHNTLKNQKQENEQHQ